MFSYFLPPISNTRPARCVTLKEAYEMIVSDKWAQTTRSLRSLPKEEQADFKRRQLPFVTFSGIFTLRHNEHLVRHSGLLCFDFDHVGNETSVRDLQQRLISDPILNVNLAFRSPSGDGLKLVVKNNFTPENHNAKYAQLAQYILQHYNITVDHTNDIARACFLCHDPKAYYNSQFIIHNSQLKKSVLSVGDKISQSDKNSVNQRSLSPWRENSVNSVRNKTSVRDKTLETAIQRIEQHHIDVTTHYHDWYRIGMALASHYGEAGRDYYHRISRFYPHYTPQETNKQYDLCLRYNTHRIHLGTLFYLIQNTDDRVKIINYAL